MFLHSALPDKRAKKSFPPLTESRKSSCIIWVMEFTVRQFAPNKKVFIGTQNTVNTKDLARKTNMYMYTIIISSTLKPRLVASFCKVMTTNLEEGQVKLSHFSSVVKHVCVIYENRKNVISRISVLYSWLTLFTFNGTKALKKWLAHLKSAFSSEFLFWTMTRVKQRNYKGKGSSNTF